MAEREKRSPGTPHGYSGFHYVLHDMTNVVHSFGTKILLQLEHSGFQSNPVNCEGRQSVSPSEFMGTREMTNDEVKKVIQDLSNVLIMRNSPDMTGSRSGRRMGIC